MNARIYEITGKIRELVAQLPLADQLRASIAVERARARARERAKPRPTLRISREDGTSVCARCFRSLRDEEQLLNTQTWQITCATCAQRME